MQMIKAHAHLVTVNQLRCFEGQVPPDIEAIRRFMGNTTTTMLAIKKMAKQLKMQRLWI